MINCEKIILSFIFIGFLVSSIIIGEVVLLHTNKEYAAKRKVETWGKRVKESHYIQGNHVLLTFGTQYSKGIFDTFMNTKQQMIAKWKMKAIVQKGISFLPKKDKINYWFQKNITKGVYLTDEYFDYKITHAQDHLRFFKKYSDKQLPDCNVLELGTGWYPIIPIAFFLNDLKLIHSLDLTDWMTKANLQTTCNKFIEWHKAGKLQTFLPYINEEKWNIIKALATDEQQTLDQMCQQIKLKRWVGDARKTDFESDTMDLICSNNTFEHIPKSILIPILLEFNRICKPKGVMSHFIDMSDHFAHFDSSINIYNFLRFSEKSWNRIDNSIQPQNRMRFKDYLQIYQDQKLPVTHEEVRPGDLTALKEIPLAAMYEKYSLKELAISHGYIVSKMG